MLCYLFFNQRVCFCVFANFLQLIDQAQNKNKTKRCVHHLFSVNGKLILFSLFVFNLLTPSSSSYSNIQHWQNVLINHLQRLPAFSDNLSILKFLKKVVSKINKQKCDHQKRPDSDKQQQQPLTFVSTTLCCVPFDFNPDFQAGTSTLYLFYWRYQVQSGGNSSSIKSVPLCLCAVFCTAHISVHHRLIVSFFL